MTSALLTFLRAAAIGGHSLQGEGAGMDVPKPPCRKTSN